MAVFPKTPAGACTVLVVDDTIQVRSYLRRVLEAEGYCVHEAGDGIEALSVLAMEPGVDLVVSDLRMPRMNGWELAGKLAGRSPRLPILFVSGYDAHLGALELPGPILAKPFTPETLVASVRDLVWGPQPRSA